jgi:hypothetical protein
LFLSETFCYHLLVKHDFHYHLLASLVLFFIISIFLVIFKSPNIEILHVFLGILFGSFILDIDHFIFWYFLKPNLEESRLARTVISHYDVKSTYRLLKTSQQTHYNLIFHHYFFQVILVLFSFFIFTSTNNLFISSLVITLNLHLLVDEYIDYFSNPKILQRWLFARESTQLPTKFLGRYLSFFSFFLIIFIFLLIYSQL